MTPAFQIMVGGVDVTGNFNDRLIKLAVSDEAGVESDTVEIEVDDRGHVIATPRKGAIIMVSMGYLETGLSLMGRYTVDEVEVETAPSVMRVKGKAADLRDTFKQQKSRHFEDTTLGEIFQRVARDHGLAAAVDQTLAQRQVKYVAQTEESDLHFMTRLARRHDAMAAPKNGRLVVVRHGDGRTSSGAAMAGLVITPAMVTKAKASTGDRPKHGKVEADFYDSDKAERRHASADASGDGPTMRLPHVYPTEEEAKHAADARGRELGRAEGSLSVEMPGRTDIMAEMPVMMQGFRDPIAGAWTTSRVQHEISDDGYQTRFECGQDKKKGGGSSGGGSGGGGGGGGSFYD